MSVGPRVLVTGFAPFPGAPVNPTEWLVARLRENPPVIAGMDEFRAEVLPVDYAALGPKLTEIGIAFHPNIAIHFGLAKDCSGFRLERLARNRFASSRADNSGMSPTDGPICGGPETISSSLPLDSIHDALIGANLPVEWSDDAGDYLCNMVMTLSLAGACDGFCPKVSGFIHVPKTGANEKLSDQAFLDGAHIVIERCENAA